MSYLLDTCLVSELARPRPNTGVLVWLDGRHSDEIYLSSITIGELAQGIAILPSGRRREGLEDWYALTVREFEGSVIDFDRPVAEAWGSLVAGARRRGRSLPTIDSMLAATALSHELTMVTRNVADFDGLGIEVHNPWTA